MSVIIIERAIGVLTELSECENLRVTVTESAKGAVLAGTCAFVGGLVGGPVGLGIGGVFGAIAAACRSREFKPVAHVIMYDMTQAQRERLAYSLIQAFKNMGINDMLLLLPMVMTNDSMKAIALDVLKKFLLSNGYLL